MSGSHSGKGPLAKRVTPVLRNALRSSRLARRNQSALNQMADLHEFTLRTLQMNLGEKPGPSLAAHLHELFGFEGVAIFDADLDEVYQAGNWRVDPGEMAQNVFHFESSDDDPMTGLSRRVLHLGSVPIGSLLLRGDSNPLTNSTIAAIVAITFDRYRATANESRIEAEREAEQMRATVLDSLAHAYKTPLTAIRAASSGLSEMGRLTPSQAELVSLIDEQANLLNELTTRLLTTARLDSGDAETTLALKRENVAAGPLVDEALTSLGERTGCAKISTYIPDDLIFSCDRRLITMLLTQYLDNACKYSDADSVITVRAQRTGRETVFSVHSFGPVIPLSDRERIFDRYYRSSTSSTRAAGTGIGLSIAKRAALAHQGAVWVSSDEVEGTTFFAAIPEPQEEDPVSPLPDQGRSSR